MKARFEGRRCSDSAVQKKEGFIALRLFSGTNLRTEAGLSFILRRNFCFHSLEEQNSLKQLIRLLFLFVFLFVFLKRGFVFGSLGGAAVRCRQVMDVSGVRGEGKLL